MQIRDIATQCLHDEAEAILQTIPQLDEAFDRAVELMLHCTGKVVVTGVGKSGHVGAKIAATLASTGTPSFYLNPLDAFHGDLGMVSKSLASPATPSRCWHAMPTCMSYCMWHTRPAP